MKKKWVIFTISILGVFIFLYFGIFKFFREIPFSQQTPTKQSDPYFAPISITKWTDGQAPCLPIQIESELISSKLDLGFEGCFSVLSDTLNRIEEKKYVGSRDMYGIRGHKFEEKMYEIPEVQIGHMSFYHHIIQEQAKDFHIHGGCVKNGEKASPPEPGRIGWEIVRNTNLFLDLDNAIIAFCDGLSTLKGQGYAVESFIKTPLISERGFLEIDALTQNGRLRCILDTGCTFNVLNMEAQEGQNIDELIWNPENFREIPLFKITEIDFGPITFRQIPIKLPIHVEAILGMDFFTDNIVFIDFTNHFVYFAPAVKKLSS